MRRHAKAATAGSTQRQAGRLGSIFRGALIARGISGDSNGSGAASAKRLVIPVGVFAALLALMIAAVPASASKAHQFSSSFGAAGAGSGQFSSNKGMAVDQSDGSIYVVDSGNFRVQKFDAAGNFVLAFGKGVNQTNPGDVCTAVSTDVCRAGAQGSGGSGFDTNGGFSNPTFVAIDPGNGDVYVADSGTGVVDKFSSAGAFISSTDGSGSGSAFGSLAGLAVDSSRNLWVYDGSAQMREFDSSGTFVAQWNSGFGVTAAGIAVDSSQNLYVVRGSGVVERLTAVGADLGEVGPSTTATSLAVDPATDELYIGAQIGTEARVRRFAGGCVTPCSSNEEFGSANITDADGIAVRSSNATVYVSDPGKSAVAVFNAIVFPGVVTGAASSIGNTTVTLNGTVNPDGVELSECVFEWGTSTSYGETAPCVPNEAGIGSGTSPVAVHADLSGLALGNSYHYRLKAVNANGSTLGEDEALQTLGPVINGTWSRDVVHTEATLKANINAAGSATTYRFEWGKTTAYGNTGPEAAVGSDSDDHEVSTFLDELNPDSIYHYRVVATSSDGDVNEGPDRTFVTFAVVFPDVSCPNQAFRGGPSAQLPDCRAYEMVSPVDKNGKDILASIFTFAGVRPAYDQSAVKGGKITYSATGSFGDQTSARGSDQYVATRGVNGWSTHGINAPLGQTLQEPHLNFVGDVLSQFKLFTPDLSSAWITDTNRKPLTPDASVGWTNLYRRDNVGDSYEALTTSAPTSAAFIEGEGYLHEVEGHSSDFSQIIFAVRGALTPDAPTWNDPQTEPWQLYDHAGGQLHLVSVLPDGTAAVGSSSAGTVVHFHQVASDEYGMVNHAVSDDGSRIFWTHRPAGAFSINVAGGPGVLYVRENPTQPQSALNGSDECTEPAKACTKLVSGGIENQFWTASADGSTVIYSRGGLGSTATLNQFDVDTDVTTAIAGEVGGVVGASDDASYVYFTSKEDLDAGATAGKWNLYLSHEGATVFIATLSNGDRVGSGEPGKAVSPGGIDDPAAINHAARVTPDGLHLAFMSDRSLTGYDNTDALNGEADREVFLYDADANDLICASCNPSRARPAGQEMPIPYTVSGTDGASNHTGTWAAAWLSTWVHNNYASRALSEDGSRLFFNSYDALVPEDTNGAEDVYQWEAQGTGSCHEVGGCVSLLSTGKSPDKSEFIDATPDGSEVFFETSSRIDPRDPGLIDIYAARVDGGFPVPPSPPACVGDACQNIPSAPNDATPASASFKGAGSPAPLKPRRSCTARNRHAGKANKHAKQHKRTKHCKRDKRGAGR